MMYLKWRKTNCLTRCSRNYNAVQDSDTWPVNLLEDKESQRQPANLMSITGRINQA